MHKKWTNSSTIAREQKRPWPRRLRRQISRQQSLMEGSRHPSYPSHRRSTAVGNSCFADCTMNILAFRRFAIFHLPISYLLVYLCTTGKPSKNVRQGSPLIKHYHSIHQNITAQGHVWIILRQCTMYIVWINRYHFPDAICHHNVNGKMASCE